jgi:hypothetical protein
MRHLNNKKSDHFVSYRTHRGPLVARVDLLPGESGPLMPSHHGEHGLDRVAASHTEGQSTDDLLPLIAITGRAIELLVRFVSVDFPLA